MRRGAYLPIYRPTQKVLAPFRGTRTKMCDALPYFLAAVSSATGFSSTTG